MIKQECIGIPDMILLLMIFWFQKNKDQSRNSTEPRRGLFLKSGNVYFFSEQFFGRSE